MIADFERVRDHLQRLSGNVNRAAPNLAPVLPMPLESFLTGNEVRWCSITVSYGRVPVRPG
jgi:hypothetical protein